MDARADEGGVTIGGWWPQQDESGKVKTELSPWFAVQLTPETAPWVYQKSGEAKRVIGTLEALGLLLALLAFGPIRKLEGTNMLIQAPAFTDNHSNGYVVNRLMTTKYPLCVVIMEIAAQAESRGVRLEAQWTPRDRNQEADRLSNLNTQGFDPNLEIKLELKGSALDCAPGALAGRTEVPGSQRAGRGREAGRAEEGKSEKEEGRQTPKQGEVVRSEEARAQGCDNGCWKRRRDERGESRQLG